MTKISKNSQQSKKCYITDKAIVNFIKAHSKRPNIDFSKIKIPSFLDLTGNEQENEDFLLNNTKTNF